MSTNNHSATTINTLYYHTSLVFDTQTDFCLLARIDLFIYLFIIHFGIRNFTAMKPHEIQEKLGLTRIRDRNWYVQPACATTGDGLYEGLTWLTSNHKS